MMVGPRTVQVGMANSVFGSSVVSCLPTLTFSSVLPCIVCCSSTGQHVDRLFPVVKYYTLEGLPQTMNQTSVMILLGTLSPPSNIISITFYALEVHT